jgi:hypothetical protein
MLVKYRIDSLNIKETLMFALIISVETEEKTGGGG